MKSLRSTGVQELIRVLATWFINQREDLVCAPRGGPYPDIPSVYLMTDKDDGVLYAGQSKFIATRMKGHETNRKKVVPEWARLYWFEPGIKSLTLRLMVEGILILALRPPLNEALLLKLCRAGLAEIRYRRKGRPRKVA